jgi:hypothetical protein
MEILDMKCAEYGEKIGREVSEDLLRKSLGVLQEDGVYAFFLWCKSKEEKIKENAFAFLKEDGVLNHLFTGEETDQLKAIRDKFKDNLDALLFAKELLERTLVYARYHAKAFPSPQSSPQRGEEVDTVEPEKEGE